ncbi:MAG: hypothetical protein KDD62_13120, partial [Bdellovibrionales bacterium]|nr:hypothetical protein [Bdellovibrionales bacterium]
KLFVRSDRESFPLPFEFKELDSQQYGERKRVMPQPLVVEELYQAMVQEILSVLETLRELNPALIPPNVAEMLQEVQKQ